MTIAIASCYHAAMKIQFNCRVSEKTLATVREIAGELGVSQSDVVTMAVRIFRERELGRGGRAQKNSDNSTQKDLTNA